MLYHSMLKFHLIDLVVVEISRHEVYSGSLLEGGYTHTLNPLIFLHLVNINSVHNQEALPDLQT